MRCIPMLFAYPLSALRAGVFGTGYDAAPPAGEPAGHRLGARCARRWADLTAIVVTPHGGDLAPILAALPAHRALVVTLTGWATATHPSRPSCPPSWTPQPCPSLPCCREPQARPIGLPAPNSQATIGFNADDHLIGFLDMLRDQLVQLRRIPASPSAGAATPAARRPRPSDTHRDALGPVIADIDHRGEAPRRSS
jgi:hypothetical protein